MEIYTIGFTKRSAEDFFEALRRHDVDRLVDVRINNVSQLAGFAKRDDLAYFLRRLIDADYVHEPALAPTRELLKAFRDGILSWDEYEREFLGLLAERRIETTISKSLFDGRSVLLCSEHSSDRCHRRLVVDYLNGAWGGIERVDL